MSISPPQEPIDIRGESVTPQSPKPVRLPSTATVTRLDQQVDPFIITALSKTPIPMAIVAVPSEAPTVAEALEVPDGDVGDAGGTDISLEQEASNSSEQNQTVSSVNEINGNQDALQSSTILSTEILPTEQNQDDLKPKTSNAESDPPVVQPAISPPQIPTSGVDVEALLNSIAPKPSANITNESAFTTETPQSQFPVMQPFAQIPDVSNAPLAASYNPMTINTAPQTSNIQQFQQNTPLPSPGFSRNQNSTEDDGPFPPDLEAAYVKFLDDEAKNVADAKWERFPEGSRLFIGNLATEKVGKRDIFRRFYKYGSLAQISLKNAYGFVQFIDTAACNKARISEQDQYLIGRKMHLEISKPQTKGAKDRGGGGGRRRSRSPDNRRDRFSGNQSNRENRRSRDDYRRRSPSPRRRRSPDLYDGKARQRSKSPYRDRHGRKDNFDDLDLPRRSPQDVPEVQILVVDDLDRNFIKYIEDSFRERGVRSDVLILSQRLSEQAVIRRQILEGVLAVVRLTRASQAISRIPLQLFNRHPGTDQVGFEDYVDLEPRIATELVLRARQTQTSNQYISPQPNSYAMQSYGIPTQQQQQQQQQQMDLSSILGKFGNPQDLQATIAGFQQQQAFSGVPPSQSGQPDISQILAAAAAATGNQHHNSYTSQSTAQPTIDYASLLQATGQQQQRPPQQIQQPQVSQAPQQQLHQPNLQELMAQLSKYQK